VRFPGDESCVSFCGTLFAHVTYDRRKREPDKRKAIEMLTHLHNGSASEMELFFVEEINLSRSAYSGNVGGNATVGSFTFFVF